MMPPSSAQTERSSRCTSVDAPKPPQSKTRRSSASLPMWSHTFQPFPSSLPNVCTPDTNRTTNNTTTTTTNNSGSGNVSFTFASPACSSVPTLSLSSPRMSSPITARAREGERVLVAVRCRPPNLSLGERLDDVIVSMDVGRKQIYVQPEGAYCMSNEHTRSSRNHGSRSSDNNDALHWNVDVPLWSCVGQSKDGSTLCTQAHVYDIVGRPLLLHALDGFNSTLMAYGQTGSGKTYTMMGDGYGCRNPSRSRTYRRYADGIGDGGIAPHDDSVSPMMGASDSRALSRHCGLIPRICHDLFDEIGARTAAAASSLTNGGGREWQVYARYVEVYNEHIGDLLNHNAPVTLREEVTAQQSSFVLVGARRVRAHAAAELLHQLDRGNRCRRTAETYANEHSSRSHAIFCIELTEVVSAALPHTETGGEGDHATSKSMTIRLVDLAGSERMTEWTNTAQHVQEIKDINRSLFTLGQVIECLSHSKSRLAKQPPYRDSILTKLLRDALGGNSKTTIIGTISPCASSRLQTLQTLHYASKARHVRNKPRVCVAQQHTAAVRMRGGVSAMTPAASSSSPFASRSPGDANQQGQQSDAYAVEMAAAEARLQRWQSRWQDAESAVQSRVAALCETQARAETRMTALERRGATLLERLSRDVAMGEKEEDEAVGSRRSLLPDNQTTRTRTNMTAAPAASLCGNTRLWRRLEEVCNESHRHCSAQYAHLTRHRTGTGNSSCPAHACGPVDKAAHDCAESCEKNEAHAVRDECANGLCALAHSSSSSSSSLRFSGSPSRAVQRDLPYTGKPSVPTAPNALVQCAHDCLDVHHWLAVELMCRAVVEEDEQRVRRRLQQRCVQRRQCTTTTVLDISLDATRTATTTASPVTHSLDMTRADVTHKESRSMSGDVHSVPRGCHDVKHSPPPLPPLHHRRHHHDGACALLIHTLVQLEERERATLIYARSRDVLFMAWTMRVCDADGAATPSFRSSPMAIWLTSLSESSLLAANDAGAVCSAPVRSTADAHHPCPTLCDANESAPPVTCVTPSKTATKPRSSRESRCRGDEASSYSNSSLSDRAVECALHRREAALRAQERALERRLCAGESRLQRRRAALAQDEHRLRDYLYELECTDAAAMKAYAGYAQHREDIRAAVRATVSLFLERSAWQCRQLCAAEEAKERDGIERICHAMLALDRAKLACDEAAVSEEESVSGGGGGSGESGGRRSRGGGGGRRAVRRAHALRRREPLRRLKQQLRAEKARLLEHIGAAEAKERACRARMRVEDDRLARHVRALLALDGEGWNAEEESARRVHVGQEEEKEEKEECQRRAGVCGAMVGSSKERRVHDERPPALDLSLISSPALSVLSSLSSVPRARTAHNTRAARLSKMYVYDTSKLLAQREQQLVRERALRRELNHTAATLVTDLLREMEALRCNAGVWRTKFHTLRAEFKVECEVCHWKNEPTRERCLCCGNTRLLCGVDEELGEEEAEATVGHGSVPLAEAVPEKRLLLLRSSSGVGANSGNECHSHTVVYEGGSMVAVNELQ